MENILDLYQQEINPTRPLVCFDEASKQLLAEVRTPLPLIPGQPIRYDSEYIRTGVANMFIPQGDAKRSVLFTVLNL